MNHNLRITVNESQPTIHNPYPIFPTAFPTILSVFALEIYRARERVQVLGRRVVMVAPRVR
eukprot:10228070-Lingulodinium_polyedra.AAC.1